MTTWYDIQAKLDGVAVVRHAVFTFAGTWAAPGTGYPSDVCNAANQNRIYEVPIQAPWSFGPVGGGAINSPSYEQSVETAYQNGCAAIEAHKGTFMIGGYSQGGEAASRVANEVWNGSLQHRKGDFVFGYTFGNPWRQKGSFVGPKDPGGCGIAKMNLANTPTNMWFDYAQPGDLYTTKLDGQAGVDEEDVYSLATQLQLGDMVKFAQDMVTTLQGGLIKDVTGVLTNPLVNGVAAARAIGAGLSFIANPNGATWPHISYHVGQITPGTTYLQHAVMSVNQFAAATPARIY